MNEGFNLNELELFAELTTFVTIIPSFSDQALYLLEGQISEFKANHETNVPLWLALLFKKQQKCRIMPPYWMKEQRLQELYSKQCQNSELINLQNTQFFQLSYIILNNAADDLDNPTRIRNLVDSLKDVRQKNILKKLKAKGGFVINNVTTYEINKFQSSKNFIMENYENLNSIKSKQSNQK